MDGVNSKQSKTNANVSNDQGETFRTPSSLVSSECSSSSRTEWETNLEGSRCGSGKISSDSPVNVSSPWSNSSADEQFQVNPQVANSTEPNDIPKHIEGVEPESLHKNGKDYSPTESSQRWEESSSDSPQSTSRFSDITVGSFVPHILPTESPSIQVMDRTESFDPNSIPDPIFGRPDASLDWSIASDESLFSLHIANDSFSNDQSFRMSAFKSGELLKSGELFLSREFRLSGELCQSKGVETNQNMDKSKDANEAMKPGTKAVVHETNGDVTPGLSDPCNANHHSDGNKICIEAFVTSPKENPACQFCHCLYSSCVYCSCKWCSWPSCSSNCFSCCYQWPYFCYWKWPNCYWSSCCCKCHDSIFCCPGCYCWSRGMKRLRSNSFIEIDGQ